MPDGSPMPSGMGHALLALATYWPHIWPGQERLAGDMKISRRNVNRRLKALEDAGFIVRHRRGTRSTAYQLNMRLIRLCDGSVTRLCDVSVPNAVTLAPQEEQLMDEGEDFIPF